MWRHDLWRHLRYRIAALSKLQNLKMSPIFRLFPEFLWKISCYSKSCKCWNDNINKLFNRLRTDKSDIRLSDFVMNDLENCSPRAYLGYYFFLSISNIVNLHLVVLVFSYFVFIACFFLQWDFTLPTVACLLRMPVAFCICIHFASCKAVFH